MNVAQFNPLFVRALPRRRTRLAGRVVAASEPRGGIEPSPIQLKDRHFLNDNFPVYLPVGPVLDAAVGLSRNAFSVLQLSG